MLQITKIFRFESAHAIGGYPGQCSNLHGHSYVLHVTVAREPVSDHLVPPGFIVDFKELKHMVNGSIVSLFDHRTLVSSRYLAQHPALASLPNLWIWASEPTAEHILLHIRDALRKCLPQGLSLKKLKLFETTDSYAEWEEN